MRILILLLVATSLSCNILKPSGLKYKSSKLRIEQINENLFVHISYLPTQYFGLVECNGMVYINNGQAIIFDTPVNDSASIELIQWINDEHKSHINGVIINHAHVDCLGGLKAFHNKSIPSYAYDSTIAMAGRNDMPIPLNGFSNELVLTMGNAEIITTFFGPGHTTDNVVSFIPSEEALFGGCLIKCLGAGKGNLEDARTQLWPGTVQKLKVQYPNLKVVIPGHGPIGNKNLLDYTIKLFQYEQ